MDTGENKEKNGEKEKKGEKVGKKEKAKEEVKEKERVDLKEAARDSEREQSCTGDAVRDRSVSEITI